MAIDPLEPIRAAVFAPLQRTMGADRFPQEQYDEPAGDPGLFGPDSVTWRVHADPAMLVGGFSSLFLQSLHPLAMAGVAEHSDYRERPFQRLSRTASFVTATTYGSTEVAEAVIEVVKAVHGHVRGTAPDGRAYAAGDPELLTWVHVAEFRQFLQAHRRYNPRPVGPAEQDRYFAETAVVAERLGGADVPRSRAEVADYLRRVRPTLASTEQSMDAVRWLQRPIGTDPLTQAVSVLLMRAAIGLLPGWARALHGLQHPAALELGVIRPATFSVLTALRTLGGEPPVIAAARARALATGTAQAA